MFPMPSRKARIQHYVSKGMTQAQAEARISQIEAESTKVVALWQQKLVTGGVKAERPGVYRLQGGDVFDVMNDPVMKAFVAAGEEVHGKSRT